LDEVLITHANVCRSQLITLRYLVRSGSHVQYCKCMHPQVYRSSICNGGLLWRTVSVCCKRAQLGSM